MSQFPGYALGAKSASCSPVNDEIDKMYAAWVKSCLLQVTL